MDSKLVSSILTVSIIIVIITVWCFVIPTAYNASQEHAGTRVDSCKILLKQIQDDKINNVSASIIVNEQNTYHNACMG